jgi:hypothetical protein
LGAHFIVLRHLHNMGFACCNRRIARTGAL